MDECSGAGGDWPPDPLERAAAVAGIGLRTPLPPGARPALAALLAGDPDPRVRIAALGALARAGAAAPGSWVAATHDSDASVRRRAADLGPAFAPVPNRREEGAGVAHGLVGLLGDPDDGVAEAAAWALGELGAAAVTAGAVDRLAAAAGGHRDPLVREAAVAALGSLGDVGDPRSLAAVLGACTDRPAIRRRAVLALAAFEGPEVEAALRAALTDKDWQTRQAAEDLGGGV